MLVYNTQGGTWVLLTDWQVGPGFYYVTARVGPGFYYVTARVGPGFYYVTSVVCTLSVSSFSPSLHLRVCFLLVRLYAADHFVPDVRA